VAGKKVVVDFEPALAVSVPPLDSSVFTRPFLSNSELLLMPSFAASSEVTLPRCGSGDSTRLLPVLTAWRKAALDPP
jgi:hypothetical protein